MGSSNLARPIMLQKWEWLKGDDPNLLLATNRYFIYYHEVICPSGAAGDEVKLQAENEKVYQHGHWSR